MKTLQNTARLALLGTVAVLAGPASEASAQVNLVTNGRFTVNASSFLTWPGYTSVGNPASISGWTNVYGGGVGVNGSGVGFSPANPFGPSNDGGYTYAFLQGGVSALSHCPNSSRWRATERINWSLMQPFAPPTPPLSGFRLATTPRCTSPRGI
jgi:hypothetical protein